MLKTFSVFSYFSVFSSPRFSWRAFCQKSHAFENRYMYRELLADSEPDRTLYLAVPKSAWLGIFAEELGRLILERLRLRVIVFELKTERIIAWIN